MAKVLFALSVLGFVVWVYTLIDCIRTDQFRVRGLPKVAWVFVVIALPLVGSVLWFAIGKERQERREGPRSVNRQKAPDDDPAFLSHIGMEQDREARIRRLEERLAELDDDGNNNKQD